MSQLKIIGMCLLAILCAPIVILIDTIGTLINTSKYCQNRASKAYKWLRANGIEVNLVTLGDAYEWEIIEGHVRDKEGNDTGEIYAVRTWNVGLYKYAKRKGMK